MKGDDNLNEKKLISSITISFPKPKQFGELFKKIYGNTYCWKSNNFILFEENENNI